jgi:hypothetical protein
MKKRHIATGLIMLSVVALAFVATVAAVGVEHEAFLIVEKHGKEITFIIETNFDSTNGYFSAYDVDPSSISILIYDQKGNLLPEITPDQTAVQSFNTYTIKIYLTKQDGMPPHALTIEITGNIIMGTYAGDTFSATGLGWGWGGHY